MRRIRLQYDQAIAISQKNWLGPKASEMLHLSHLHKQLPVDYLKGLIMKLASQIAHVLRPSD